MDLKNRWIFFSENGVGWYHCGNPTCRKSAPMDYTEFNFCPYCGSPKIRESNSINKYQDEKRIQKLLYELDMEYGNGLY